MKTPQTQMRREIEEIPAAVDRLLTEGTGAMETALAHIPDQIPFLISVARGSSDHACTFLKYASEIELGLPMASVGPSVASLYKAPIKADRALCLAVSQSGKSPDIVSLTKSLKGSGATCVAITNGPASPLAQAATVTLPLSAGPERSVAATKTFVTSLVAGLWLIASIKRDPDLVAAIRKLPDHLDHAIGCDWSRATDAIQGQSVFTLGRGPSWAISNEAALKFKETCQLHAESYSSAEVLHGPVSIVGPGFPVLAFAAGDAAETSVAEVADSLVQKGASVFATTDKVTRAQPLPHRRTDHWLTDPIATITTFYATVERLAVARGIDPDAPRHLNKVTETV